jgi:PAS domain S-box-containing protein
MDRNRPPTEDDLKRLTDRVRDLEEEVRHCREIQKGIEESEKRYRAIFENTGTATAILDDDMTLLMVNSEFERLSGFSRQEVEGKRKWMDLVHPDDLEMMLNHHIRRRTHPDTTPKNYIYRVRKKNGTKRIAMLTVDLIRGTRQSVASVQDITEQKRLEKKILEITELERRKIGFTLHDDLGQHLIGIEALSVLLKHRLDLQNHPEAGLALEITDLIHEAIGKTKTLTKGLCPVDMDAGGLVSSLNELKDYIRNVFGIDCTLECTPDLSITDNTVATNLYLIIREAVSNARRHGHADRIIITLQNTESHLAITVRDNGTGFSGEKSDNGLGLSIMEFRATSIGATFELNSTPGKGTEILCTLKHESS